MLVHPRWTKLLKWAVLPALRWFEEYLRRWPVSEDTERAQMFIASCKRLIARGWKPETVAPERHPK